MCGDRVCEQLPSLHPCRSFSAFVLHSGKSSVRDSFQSLSDPHVPAVELDALRLHDDAIDQTGGTQGV